MNQCAANDCLALSFAYGHDGLENKVSMTRPMEKPSSAAMIAATV